jgi:hypothetical protein
MSGLDLRKMVIAGVIGLMVFIIGSSDATAQSRREIERERQRIARENARIQRERQRRYQRQDRATVVTPQMERRVNNANYSTGYTYGYMAGQNDRRRGKYNLTNVYRDTGPYRNDGDPTHTDYIYRQGYLQGYNDGFNGVRNY